MVSFQPCARERGGAGGWSFDEPISSLALASARSGLEGGIVGRVGP